jgi:hypothetical protein
MGLRNLGQPEMDVSIELPAHDYELQYSGLEPVLKLAVTRLDGIFGAAEKMIQCLKNRTPLRWVALPLRGYAEFNESGIGQYFPTWGGLPLGSTARAGRRYLEVAARPCVYAFDETNIGDADGMTDGSGRQRSSGLRVAGLLAGATDCQHQGEQRPQQGA